MANNPRWLLQRSHKWSPRVSKTPVWLQAPLSIAIGRVISPPYLWRKIAFFTQFWVHSSPRLDDIRNRRALVRGLTIDGTIVGGIAAINFVNLHTSTLRHIQEGQQHYVALDFAHMCPNLINLTMSNISLRDASWQSLTNHALTSLALTGGSILPVNTRQLLENMHRIGKPSMERVDIRGGVHSAWNQPTRNQ
jgi:hypothetical protein